MSNPGHPVSVAAVPVAAAVLAVAAAVAVVWFGMHRRRDFKGSLSFRASKHTSDRTNPGVCSSVATVLTATHATKHSLITTHAGFILS